MRQWWPAALVAAMLAVACEDMPEPTTITISPPSETLVALDATVALTATVLDQNGRSMPGVSVTWTSRGAGVASVDRIGLVTARSNGEAVIEASAGSAVGRASVTVDQVAVAVRVSPESDTLAALGEVLPLSARAFDANGHGIADAVFLWGSSDPLVAAVDASGSVTAVGNGTAVVTAGADAASGTATLTVVQVPVEVRVEPDSAEVVEGDTLRLAAIPADANGHPVEGTVLEWASGDTAVAVVDTAGLVTGVGAGRVEITASVAEVAGSGRVAVLAPVPTAIAVAPGVVAMTALGQFERLSAEVRDQIGRIMDGVAVAWTSSDTAVVAVDSGGVVVAVARGSATITASAGEASGEADVSVMQVAGSLSLSPDADTIGPGDTLRLVAEARDANGNPIDGAEVAWSSSDASVAVVDDTGLLTGRREGAVTITASLEELEAISAITVANPDRAALVAIYEAASRPEGWDNWGTGAPLNEWRGVWVDGFGRVVTLNLEGRDLRSDLTELPPEIGILGNLEYLDLDNHRLTELPPEIGNLGNLEWLSLDSNQLTELPPEIGNLGNLEWLSLDSNQLTELPPEIGNLGSLRSLHLDNNHLAELPSEIGNLGNLTGLRLGSNQLTELPPEIGNLGSLWSLLLDDNQLTELPSEIGNLGNLRSLYLGSNQLTELPPDIGNLANLWTLSLGSNQLAELPPQIWNLVNLGALDLDNSQLTELPPEIWNLVNLTELRLGSNQLTELPPEIGNLGSLGTLDLTYNQLTELPPEIGSLGNLTQLRLGSNQLSELPPEIGNFGNLRGLYLHNNHLTALPPEIGNLGNLTGLDLDNNQLTELPPEIGNLGNLDWLDLGSNQLSELPAEIGNFGNQRGLYLHNNQLTALPPEIGNLGNLRWLYLHNNQLTELPPEIGNLDNLRGLYLHNNQLIELPPEIGSLGNLDWLNLSNNQLTGPLPSFFLQLYVSSLSLDGNDGLCIPGSSIFVASWIGRQFRSILCNAADIATLDRLYRGTGGRSWKESAGWLDGSHGVEHWHGIVADSLGRVLEIDLSNNGLSGVLSEAAFHLPRLEVLRIGQNPVSGRLPTALSALPLRELRYSGTSICVPDDASFRSWLAAIPVHDGTGIDCAPRQDREILEVIYRYNGGPWPHDHNWLTDAPLEDWDGVSTDTVGRVVGLNLDENGLQHALPPEIGGLSELRWLSLDYNGLSGPIPSELGNLANLEVLRISGELMVGGFVSSLHNALSGPIPPELGNLAKLRKLDLGANDLDGGIPPELGELSELTFLNLARNNLSGSVPPELGRLASLEDLRLSGNSELAGALPDALRALTSLRRLWAGGTDLCVHLGDSGVRAWFEGIDATLIDSCTPAAVYLTQAVQTRNDLQTVPLITGDRTLLRVFPVAARRTTELFKDVRARLYLDDLEVETVDVPAQYVVLPTAVNEGELYFSINAEVPPEVVRPGLEVVVELDSLDASLGVQRRIPAEGRMPVPVHDVPVFDMTLVPFISSEDPDSSIISLVERMAADSERHELLEGVRTLLPVGDLSVSAHAPVTISAWSMYEVLNATGAVRALEGGAGHWMGMVPRAIGGIGGVAYQPGRVSSSMARAEVIAHELGHNMSLGHAPCGGPGGVDPLYPHGGGKIGSWGYDFRTAEVVPPDRPDVMSYCGDGDEWISGYHFATALRHRLATEGAASPTARLEQRPVRSLFLWGGTDSIGHPHLEPAFVVDAPASLPAGAGDHELRGLDADGKVLFSLRFAMPELADGDGSSAFAFVLPVQESWEAGLAAITLTGPGGSAGLDADSDIPTVIARDALSGQVRAILRGAASPDSVAVEAGALSAAGARVLFSRGIPDARQWRR